MDVIVVPNPNVLGFTAAQIVADEVRRNPKAVLLLPTGGTPLPMYKRLIVLHQHERLSFSQVVSFNLDEYVGVPVHHPQSYHSYMQHSLFGHIDINPANIRLPNGNASDLEQECADYEREIAQAGGIDLAVLGVGQNGHIAFVEPPANLASRTHVAMLTASTQQANSRYFGTIADVPRRALTAGIATILDCDKILVLATGVEKSEAIARAIEGPVSPACPASALKRHNNLTYILDEAAASGLRFQAAVSR